MRTSLTISKNWFYDLKLVLLNCIRSAIISLKTFDFNQMASRKSFEIRNPNNWMRKLSWIETIHCLFDWIPLNPWDGGQLDFHWNRNLFNSTIKFDWCHQVYKQQRLNYWTEYRKSDKILKWIDFTLIGAKSTNCPQIVNIKY